MIFQSLEEFKTISLIHIIFAQSMMKLNSVFVGNAKFQ